MVKNNMSGFAIW